VTHACCYLENIALCNEAFLDYRGDWLPELSMGNLKTPRETDIERLGRLAFFSWLTPVEIKSLGRSLTTANWGRGEVIFREQTYATDAHVLIAGIARITCLNAAKERVTVGLI